MTSDWIKAPWIEDMQRCEQGQHLWILKDDGGIYCYNCGFVKKK